MIDGRALCSKTASLKDRFALGINSAADALQALTGRSLSPGGTLFEIYTGKANYL